MLAVVAWRCRLPYHSYLCEIAGDGSFLGGVELEISCGDVPTQTTQHFFWAQTPIISLSLYDQAAFQALRFLQGVYGFVVLDYNYENMVAYRELSRSAAVLAAMLACSVPPALGTGCPLSTTDVDASVHSQIVSSQLASAACSF